MSAWDRFLLYAIANLKDLGVTGLRSGGLFVLRIDRRGSESYRRFFLIA